MERKKEASQEVSTCKIEHKPVRGRSELVRENDCEDNNWVSNEPDDAYYNEQYSDDYPLDIVVENKKVC